MSIFVADEKTMTTSNKITFLRFRIFIRFESSIVCIRWAFSQLQESVQAAHRVSILLAKLRKNIVLQKKLKEK